MRQVYCPECRSEMQVTRENYGQRVKCPLCGEIFDIPVPQALLEKPKNDQPAAPTLKKEPLDLSKGIFIDGIRISIGDAFMLILNFTLAALPIYAALIALGAVLPTVFHAK